MPSIRTDDGVDLHYIEAGSGTPMVFVHEFAGDALSWEAQMRFFARRYRCISFFARGYAPSGIPADPKSYSQDRATADIAAIITGLKLEPAHVVGLSMGAFATLHLGLRYPHLARSLVAAGVGYGAEPSKRGQFQAELDASIAKLREITMEKFATIYAHGPTRLVFEEKDPRGFAEFEAQLANHSTEGAALTMQGVQRERPSLFELEAGFRKMASPTRTIPGSALVVLPKCGHTMNIEDPDAFNRAVLDFVTAVDSGSWRNRIPGSLSGAIIAAKS
jgi:pimeloyl-ACP methyl ester carboxylesterase